jgi:hypothetical protein
VLLTHPILPLILQINQQPSATAQARLDELARKANEGQLATQEAAEYDRLVLNGK